MQSSNLHLLNEMAHLMGRSRNTRPPSHPRGWNTPSTCVSGPCTINQFAVSEDLEHFGDSGIKHMHRFPLQPAHTGQRLNRGSPPLRCRIHNSPYGYIRIRFADRSRDGCDRHKGLQWSSRKFCLACWPFAVRHGAGLFKFKQEMSV